MTRSLTDPGNQYELSELSDLLAELERLASDIESEAAQRLQQHQQHYPNGYSPDALNLADYLALRSYDLRDLQTRLADVGLSSLGRGEPHVRYNLQQVINLLHRALDLPLLQHTHQPHHLLEQRAEKLFGKRHKGRYSRIMVTLPSEAAQNPLLAETLIKRGMDCARINCAHDNADAWLAMVQHIRQAEHNTGHGCRILMDLGGHKIRTQLVNVIRKKHSGKLKGPRVFVGDSILLVHDSSTLIQQLKQSNEPIRISCTYPGIIDQLEAGHMVWIDDGKLGCLVENITSQGALLRVTHAGPKGVTLRPDKGLNFPETTLDLPTLSDKDREDLGFIVKHADMVALSFVRNLDDIEQLLALLEQHQATDLPIVAKIETRLGVKELPNILLGTLGRNPLGVMIARGDLAVELGSVRMAEIQEEILWLCEAAHTPVIWATQVLETLAKKGTVSRPEITDAAMSIRAECVMLNKGDYIAEAVEVLDNILHKMDAHQYKKVSRLRKLHW